MESGTLDWLEPKSEPVLVDRVRLILRAPKCSQYGKVMAALGALNAGSIGGALQPAIDAALDEAKGDADVIIAIASNTEAIWKAITQGLGAETAAAVADGAGWLLDSEENFRALVAEKALAESQAERTDGVYTGSPALRAWVANMITPEQALYALSTAFRLGSFASLGQLLRAQGSGKLAALPAKRPMMAKTEKPSAG